MSLRWSLPGLEGSYDGERVAEVGPKGARFTIITRTPNYGGASDGGTYTLDQLQRHAVPDPITAEHCDDVLAAIARLPAS